MFISCDWGTTSFRLRLVDAGTRSVLAEVRSNQGIAETHSQWRQQSDDEGKRIFFYQSVLQHHLAHLQEQVNYTLQDLPIIVSGMASSNIGMVELPYKELPFAVDGSDIELTTIGATDSFKHVLVLISGVKSGSDVMRGEETQLMGCEFHSGEECVYIFPGTHSKHVYVKNRVVTAFKTYMTGEFFQLLSQRSILAKSVDENQSFNEEAFKKFEAGVEQSMHGNILNNAFHVRTNHLFGKYTKEENYHYLSGLLIGTELNELSRGVTPVTIVANEVMRNYYVAALQTLAVKSITAYDVDLALVNGHCKVYGILKRSQSSGISY